MHRNRLLTEYSREELEEDFLRNCEELDSRANEVYKLETKAQYLSSRLSRITQDAQDPIRQKTRFSGSQVPAAYRQSRVTVKQLQDKLITAENELAQRQLRMDNLSRQLKYFHSLQLIQQPKVRSRATLQTPPPSRDRVIKQINSLISKTTAAKMRNRLEATSAILISDYVAAEAPLRSLLTSIGETDSLHEILEKRRQLHTRETKVEALRGKLSELKQRYANLLQKQRDASEQYENELRQNTIRSEEIKALEQEKITKQQENARAAELQLIADGLRNEIRILTQQQDQLQDDNINRQQRVAIQIQETLAQLRLELQESESSCNVIREQNSKLEEEVTQLQRQYEEAKSKRGAAEDKFNQLQDDYKSIIGTFRKMVDTADFDPFEDTRFVSFLSQMVSDKMSIEEVQAQEDEYQTLLSEDREVTGVMERYAETEQELAVKIKEQRSTIRQLEKKLKKLAEELDNADDVPKERPEFTKGAPHIRTFQKGIGSGQIGLIVYFTDFSMSSELMGPSKVFLSLDFFDKEPVETNRVDPQCKVFNSKIPFTVKNDRIFKEYLAKGVIPVQLCRMKEVSNIITVVGTAELNLVPFVDGVNAFTSSVKFLSEGNTIACVANFEAALSAPLAK